MRVLVACEFSGVVRQAFRAKGHDAWSCDLLPASDQSSWHIQGDCLDLLSEPGQWDLLIAHPPCTYLTSAAEWAYGDGPYHQKVKPGTLVGAARRAARGQALEFVRALLNAPVPRIAVENPVGCISRSIRPPDQVIQPYEFGADASKATCLWLKNLPALQKGTLVPGRLVTLPSGRVVRRWANQTDSGQNRLPPGERRWAERSVTYQGVAEAMADAWGTWPATR